MSETTITEIFANIERRFWPTNQKALEDILLDLNTNTFNPNFIKDTARAMELIRDNVHIEMRAPNLSSVLVENLARQQKALEDLRDVLEDMANWRSLSDDVRDQLLKRMGDGKKLVSALLAQQKELLRSVPA
ncbi:MAG: hypothetical protein ABIJ21_02415 [Nanoarchaeota archaeon]